MCDILTAFATAVDPELAELCANITRNQIDEIGSMQSWLATATVESGDAASLPCMDGHGGHGGMGPGQGQGMDMGGRQGGDGRGNGNRSVYLGGVTGAASLLFCFVLFCSAFL